MHCVNMDGFFFFSKHTGIHNFACFYLYAYKSTIHDLHILFQFPASEQEWRDIAKQFEEKWNFPHCLGALDGKHVQIIPPAGSGSFYYNYKGYHSMVLMALANANYEFILCDFGTNGRVSDGGVLDHTKFYDKLVNCSLKLPPADKISNTNVELPYVFISDEAFALRTDLIKPFSQRDLTDEHRVFNYRLSGARRVVESMFGILATRFRIFHTKINLNPSNITDVVMACCILHNFLRKTSPNHYTPLDSLDQEDYDTVTNRTDDSSLLDLNRGYSRSAAEDAKQVREAFCNYFNNEGNMDFRHAPNIS